MADNKQKEYTGGLDRAIFREWLERLQQESWQLELIISGFALYGIHRSRGIVSDLHNYNLEGANNVFINAFEHLITTGWRIFFVNLLVHVILRSLWIGAIGLRYVSGEINYKQLNYSNFFTNYLKKKVGDYDDYIERLEKICSVIFSYTFLLFLFFLSALAFGIFSIAPMIILDLLGHDVDKNILYFLIWFFPFIFGGAIVFLDFMTLGGIKKIKNNTISKVYMPLYWVYSHITLSFLYRPLLYNFIDDKYTRRLFYFSFPYIFFIFYFDGFYTNEKTPYLPDYNSLIENGLMVNPYYYDDLYTKKMGSMLEPEVRESRKMGALRLSHYKVTEPYVQLFVKYNSSYEKVLEYKYGVTPIYKSGWKFTLFSDIGKERDTLQVALKDSFKVYERKVYEEYKIYRDSAKVIKDNQLAKDQVIFLRDSLKSLRKSLKDKKYKALEKYEDDKNVRILELFKDQARIKIDGTSYTDSINSYFGVHYLQGNEGTLYNIPVSSLSIGEHKIEIDLDRTYIKEKDSTVVWKFILPILKVQ